MVTFRRVKNFQRQEKEVMDALIAGIVVLVLLILLLTPSPSRQVYRCQKCGFTSDNELEAAGHEKLENMHKVVKE